ncbi:MAG: DUF6941 family protein, partial [Stellaceae bacterium]
GWPALEKTMMHGAVWRIPARRDGVACPADLAEGRCTMRTTSASAIKSAMPDSPFDGKLATHKPLPQCKASLICREAEFDDPSGEFDLYGLVNTLKFAEFPAQVPPLSLFLQLYDGIGRYELSVELRNLDDSDRVAAGSFGHLEFPDRLVKMELAVPIDCMRLPWPGRYEIAILFDGRELASQFIDIEAENDEAAR